ncbi:MAG: ATPase [Desulfurococcales archaeon]|nr:ATPase [Desulfurococcales archaeon]
MVDPIAQGLALAGGAIALLGGLAGSSIGIGRAGSAGTAALTISKRYTGSIFLLAALPITQTFYGLIVLINFILYVNSHPDIDLTKGIALLALGIMVCGAEFFSAMKLGDVCAVSISIIPRTRGKLTLSSMILSVYVGIIGILGMVFSIMALNLMA